MSENGKLLHSRNSWKQKAIARGKDQRAQRKEIRRLKKERDRFKQEAKAAKAEIKERNLMMPTTCVMNKIKLMFLALMLFLFARIGFRAITRVLQVLSDQLGAFKAPCPQTISNWVTRLSIAKIQMLAQTVGKGIAQGHVWLIDLSIGLGTGKILSVLSLDLHHHQQHDCAPGLAHVHCVATAVADSWNGETIADFLRQVIANVGCPSAFLKDGGADLEKAVKLLDKQGISCVSIADLSHYIANLFKHEYAEHPLFDTFLSACSQVSKKLKQTLLACLAPPKVSTKARFMNLHRIVRWADQLLKHLPSGRAAQNSMTAKLRASLDQLPLCKNFIKRFLRDATPFLECQKVLKQKGLNLETYAQCQQFLEVIPSTSPIRAGFNRWVNQHLSIANQLQLHHTGLPISTDVLESLFGAGKRLGIGQVKDAHRIASRLPAFCGTFSEEHVQAVINVSVAQQKEMIGCKDSLIKQRQDVLPHPGALESLAQTHKQHRFELIPNHELREKSPDISIDEMLLNATKLPICSNSSFTTVAVT